MSKYKIEIKWGIIFSIVSLLWMVLEKLTGLHGENIAKHAIFTNFFMIPAIIMIVLALLDKRKNYFNGKMTWLQGFMAGLIVSIVVALLSPLYQWITFKFISPDYFSNVIAYSVEQGKMTLEQAEVYFNNRSYMIQGAIGAVVMGAVTSAIVAFFVKKK